MIACVRNEPWGRIAYDHNADEFEAHVRVQRSPVTSRPLSAGCLVTGRCNLGCAFCYGNEEGLPNTEVDVSAWGRIFQHMRSWGLMRVDLSGGEPTLRRDLPDIAVSAIAEGLQVVISTNGLTPANREGLAFPRLRWHVSIDSGEAEIHERSRLLRCLTPSNSSFERTSAFIARRLDAGDAVRVLTCIGQHNKDALFALGEHLALLGVRDWNISRILRAGRAQRDYARLCEISDQAALNQVWDLRSAFPFIRIRYSNRTTQDGYFLLVLPDGSLATQYTDGRDKVRLGNALDMSLAQLQNHPMFNMAEHGRKWIAAMLEWQPEDPFIDRWTAGEATSASPMLAS
jgi:MoaA/NifB/PqqE/SkfB family radical SAM enzyme